MYSRVDVIRFRCFSIQSVQQIFFSKIADGRVSQVRIDRITAVSDQCTEVMHFSWFSGLQHKADVRACLFAYQMMMQAGNSQ